MNLPPPLDPFCNRLANIAPGQSPKTLLASHSETPNAKARTGHRVVRAPDAGDPDEVELKDCQLGDHLGRRLGLWLHLSTEAPGLGIWEGEGVRRRVQGMVWAQGSLGMLKRGEKKAEST